MSEHHGHRGKLLLAAPSMLDPNFARTVSILVEDNDEGSLGLVLNRPMEMRVEDAWDRLDQIDSPCNYHGPIYHGGPCPGPMAVIHTRPDLSLVQLGDAMHFTTDRDHIAELLTHADQELRCFVNYAGWSPVQLDDELETGCWIIAPGGPEWVFGETDTMWKTLVDTFAPMQATQLRQPEELPPDPTLN